MIKQYIQGSILDAPQKYIAHGVNCQNVMGSGVARVLFEKYPRVKEDYHTTYKVIVNNIGRHELLGGYDTSCQDDGKIILNCFTQDKYGYNNEKLVSYDAIYKIFKSISESQVKEIAIPKIGAGLAGGNWEIVSRIIDDATGDDLDVYVYYLE